MASTQCNMAAQVNVTVNVNGLEEEQQMNGENVANLPCLNLLTAQGRRVDDWTDENKQKISHTAGAAASAVSV